LVQFRLSRKLKSLTECDIALASRLYFYENVAKSDSDSGSPSLSL
jgi:hypothetical protein